MTINNMNIAMVLSMLVCIVMIHGGSAQPDPDDTSIILGQVASQDDVTDNHLSSVLQQHQNRKSGGTFDGSFPAAETPVFDKDSFNRPAGTQSIPVGSIAPMKTMSGTYGSYRKQKAWRNAVADDTLRNVFGRNGVAVARRFPWLFRRLQRPSGQGFGIKSFWNSYATQDQGTLQEATSRLQKLQGASPFGPSVTVT